MQSHQTQLTANKGLITPFCDSILENLSLTNQQKSIKYNQHYSALSKLILPCTCLIKKEQLCSSKVVCKCDFCCHYFSLLSHDPSEIIILCWFSV